MTNFESSETIESLDAIGEMIEQAEFVQAPEKTERSRAYYRKQRARIIKNRVRDFNNINFNEKFQREAGRFSSTKIAPRWNSSSSEYRERNIPKIKMEEVECYSEI